MCRFDCRAVGANEKVMIVNRLTFSSFLAVVNPTDRPTSILNHCVINILVACLCCRFPVLNFSLE